MACLELHERFDRRIYNVIGTVHDAILQEIHKDHLEEVLPVVIETMQRPKLIDTLGIKLRVPIVAEAKVGSWANGYEWKKAA